MKTTTIFLGGRTGKSIGSWECPLLKGHTMTFKEGALPLAGLQCGAPP